MKPLVPGLEAGGKDIVGYLELGLNGLVIVGVSAGGGLAQNLALCDFADEHHVAAQILFLHHFAGEHGVAVLGQAVKIVAAALDSGEILELVDFPGVVDHLHGDHQMVGIAFAVSDAGHPGRRVAGHSQKNSAVSHCFVGSPPFLFA